MEASQKIKTNWEKDSRLNRLFQALKARGGTPRLVGGVVRDTILGLPQDDYDVAINQTPQAVTQSLKSADISVIPTGIDHGTVTAVIEGHPYQITSLRTDLKTDGRRAEVAFTEDWVLDAARRDFTINALYADLDGTVYDPFQGLADLADHCVRFIGDPEARIQEDYLRVLRFFRFSAAYGKGQLHQPSLDACRKLAPHIQMLAKERITQEFFKLLKAHYATEVLEVMAETGVLKEFLPGPFDIQGMQNLRDHFESDPLLNLAAAKVLPEVAFSSFRLSNDEKFRYKQMFAFETVTQGNIHKLLYLHGTQAVSDWLKLQGSHDESLFERVKTYVRPIFPLSGQDLIDRGINGPAIGKYLKQAEAWWIDSDFSQDRKACLNYLDQLLENKGS